MAPNTKMIGASSWMMGSASARTLLARNGLRDRVMVRAVRVPSQRLTETIEEPDAYAVKPHFG